MARVSTVALQTATTHSALIVAAAKRGAARAAQLGFLTRRAVRVPWGIVWAPHRMLWTLPGSASVDSAPVNAGDAGAIDAFPDDETAPGTNGHHGAFFDELSGRTRRVPWTASPYEILAALSAEGRWWCAWTAAFATLWKPACATVRAGSPLRTPHTPVPVHLTRVPPVPLPPVPRVTTPAEAARRAGIPLDMPPRHTMSDAELAAARKLATDRAASPEEALELALIFDANVKCVHSYDEAAFLAERLMVTDAERDGIADDAQRGAAWKQHRGNRWTGSQFAKAAGMGDYGVGLQRLLKERLFPQPISSPAMRYGTLNEPRAFRTSWMAQSAAVAGEHPPAYGECGFVVDKYAPWLGASPDMIVFGTAATIHPGTDMVPTPLAHTQLPASAAPTSGAASHAALGELKCPFGGAFYEGGVTCKGDYLAQLHCNMHVLGLRTAVFTVWVSAGAQRIEHVAFDAEYWSMLMDTARCTYFEHYLPRIVWRSKGVLCRHTLLPKAVHVPPPPVLDMGGGDAAAGPRASGTAFAAPTRAGHARRPRSSTAVPAQQQQRRWAMPTKRT